MKPLARDAALVACAFALVLAAPAAGLLAAPVPAGNGPVLVIAPNAESVVAAAGGRVIGPVTAPFGALAIGDHAFAQAVAAHSWKVVPADRLAALCGAYGVLVSQR